MGLTGDQSFSEGLERSALVFYQIMTWKSELANNFYRICQKQLGRSAALEQFYNHALFDNQLDPDFTFDCRDFAAFIAANTNELLIQADVLRKIIIENFDLEKNLIPRLEQAMNDPTKIMDLFEKFITIPSRLQIFVNNIHHLTIDHLYIALRKQDAVMETEQIERLVLKFSKIIELLEKNTLKKIQISMIL